MQAGLEPADFSINIELTPVYAVGDTVADIAYWTGDVWAYPIDDDGDDDDTIPIRPPRLKVST